MNWRSRKNSYLSLVLAFNFYQPASSVAQVYYEDGAASLGIDHSYGINISGGGVSFADFNNDGWDDLTFATAAGDNVHFYQNQQGSFIKVDIPTIQNIQSTKHILWADYDNDGDQDLYITSYSVNRLYNNLGNLNFAEVTAAAGMALLDIPSFGAAWADYDLDGWLDLYITHKNGLQGYNELYRNNGDGTFVDMALEAGVTDPGKKPYCVGFIDYNNDMWPDIYIAQDRKAINTMYRNNGDGTFTDVSDASGTNLEMDGMSVTMGDFDMNGFTDIYITNIEEGNRLLRNNGDGTFEEIGEAAGVGFHSICWGASFLDYDNDLDLDLYVSDQLIGSIDSPGRMFENIGNDQFSLAVDLGFSGDTLSSFSNAIGDINNDGFPDIAVNNFFDYPSNLWVNSGNDHHWLKIKLKGMQSNRDGIGTRIEIFTNQVRQTYYTHHGVSYLGQHSNRMMVGLGNYQQVDSIKIQWPSGHTDNLFAINADQTLSIFEGSTNKVPVISGNRDHLCRGDSLRLDAGWHESYQWNTGDTTRFITVKTPGSYWVITTDENQPDQSDEFIINEPNAFEEPILMIQNVSCHDGNDGRITISNPDSTMFKYFWSNGVESSALANTPAGNYRLDVIESNGCVNSFYAYITEPKALEIDVLPSSVNSLIAHVKGGVPPYSYAWNDQQQQTAPEASGLNPGDYEVVVTDSNLCTITGAFNMSTITGMEHMAAEGMKIFPNPASGKMWVSWRDGEGDFNLKLLSIAGKVVFEKKVNFKNSLMYPFSMDIGPLLPGIYLLEITTPKSRFLEKIWLK